MNKLAFFFIVAFFSSSIDVISQKIGIDYWDSFTYYGAGEIQRYFYTPFGYSVLPTSKNLGTNIAGYDIGRFQLHSLMWGQLAWARSPEVKTDDEKRFFITLAKNKIDTMLNSQYYVDVSSCSATAFKGSTHDAINRFSDGYNGWGGIRSFDSMTPLTSELGNLRDDTWYRIKIRCENTIPGNNTALSVWLAADGVPFTATPYYNQTYKSREPDGSVSEDARDVMDNGESPDFIPSRVWMTKGTIALLSAFSNVSIKDLTVYRGLGTSRNVFYNFNSHASDYYSDINNFYNHWMRVGHEDAVGSDRNVWAVGQESGGYIIETNAADIWPGAMDSALRNTDNMGVYASAYLRYDDEIGNSADLDDYEVEFSIRIDKRNTGYAESGIAVHWNNRAGALPLSFAGGPLDAGLNGGIYSGPSEYSVAESSTIATHLSGFASFREYYRHKYRYFSINLHPDHIIVAHHRDGAPTKDKFGNNIEDGVKFFYGGTPWDTNHPIDSDSLNYFEGHNYEGEMAGAILRYCEYVTNPSTDPIISNYFTSSAVAYLSQISDNTLQKWIDASSLSSDPNALFYGACQSTNLLGTGDLDRGSIWRTSKARTGSMFQHIRNMSGIATAYQGFATNYCNQYLTQINDAIQTYQFHGLDSYNWYDGLFWWNTYDNGMIDLGHSGPEVRHVFLEDGFYGSSIAGEIGQKMADGFLKTWWNRKQGAETDISEYRCQNGRYISTYSNGYPTDDFPLLSKYDFMVWEVFNEFYEAYPDHLLDWANASAQMAYMVKYAVPRGLPSPQLYIELCNEGVITVPMLKWAPPSNYPSGYHESWNDGTGQWDWPGSGLKRYIIQARKASDPDWTFCREYTYEIQSRQKLEKYPWFIDTEAQAGEQYIYRLATQDWATAITNISDFSDEITINYPNVYSGSYPKTASGLLSVTKFPYNIIKNGENVSISVTADEGIFYAPFNILIEDGGTLTINPGVVIIFGDSCEFQVKGNLIIAGSSDCGRVLLTGESGPGSWWGVSIFPGAHHNIDFAVIENAINNIVVFDDGGMISNSTIRHALQYGIMLKNSGDGSTAQVVDNCDIYENGWSNVFINPGIYSGDNLVPIYPTVKNSRIYSSLQEDGIFVADAAYPLIQNCDIYLNYRHGVHCYWVKGDPSASQNVNLNLNRIYNHESGNGIELNNSNAVVGGNTIHHNGIGIRPYQSAILNGSLTWPIQGNNVLLDNGINLYADECSAIYFGIYNPANGGSQGGGNTFTLNNPTTGQYHIKSVSSYGFAKCNTYTPWDPNGGYVFDIPGYPFIPDITVQPTGSCPIGGGGSMQSGLTKGASDYNSALALIPTVLSSNNEMAVLEYLSQYVNQDAIRGALLTWMGSISVVGNRSNMYSNILDSLSHAWYGENALQAQAARVPVLVRCGVIDEALRIAEECKSTDLMEYVQAKTESSRFYKVLGNDLVRTQSSRENTGRRSLSMLSPAAISEVALGSRNNLNKRYDNEDLSIAIYPNPSTDFISIGAEHYEQFNSCTVVDILGRVRISVALNNSSWHQGWLKVDVSGLTTGVYVVALTGTAGTIKGLLRIE